MNDATPIDARRTYHQTARAAAAEATGERILAAFRARLGAQWFDEIRLEDVAREAGVTVQTVIRRFGGKEGLLESTSDRIKDEVIVARNTPPGDIPRLVEAVVEDYETLGDLIMRLLAQEDRYPPLKQFTDQGRAQHRQWVARMFAPALGSLPEEEARRRLDALVVATDLYLWKLLRRDMGRSVDELRSLMAQMVHAALPPERPQEQVCAS